MKKPVKKKVTLKLIEKPEVRGMSEQKLINI